ncbi:MAG TPA: PIN domain-containing protein [bacterium]|nr:PIN domain-containing protein [bacterium]
MAALARKGTRENGDQRTGRPPQAEPASAVSRALAHYRRVGLDTICFIYHLSKHPQYLPVTEELFELIEQGRLAAVTSSLVLVEVLARPQQLGNHAAVESYRVALATFPHLELRRSDIAITEQAADLRARYHLSTPEAIQLATALVDGAEVFIGNSPALRAVREIEVLMLEDLTASTASGGRA